MKIEVLQEFSNEPQGRREILLQVLHPNDPSPSREELRNELETKIGKNFVIKKEKSKFGFARSKVLAFSYDSKKTLKEVEPEHILKRDKVKVKEEG